MTTLHLKDFDGFDPFAETCAQNALALTTFYDRALNNNPAKPVGFVTVIFEPGGAVDDFVFTGNVEQDHVADVLAHVVAALILPGASKTNWAAERETVQ